MNSTEEHTAAQLRHLVQRAAAAAKTPEHLAQDILAHAAESHGERRAGQNRRPVRRRTKVGASVVAAVTVAGVVAAASLVGHSDYQQFVQPSGAMSPTIAVSQTVLVAKKLKPMRGDVILLEATNGDNKFETISRVIGLPGDAVSCPREPDGTCKAVIVSGQPLNEPWLNSRTSPFPQVTVSAGHVFLLSDSRDNAVDSRIYGPQALNAVVGVVIARYTSGRREALPGAPPHQLPDEYNTIDPAGPVPPAQCREASGDPCK